MALLESRRLSCCSMSSKLPAKPLPAKQQLTLMLLKSTEKSGKVLSIEYRGCNGEKIGHIMNHHHVVNVAYYCGQKRKPDLSEGTHFLFFNKSNKARLLTMLGGAFRAQTLIHRQAF